MVILDTYFSNFPKENDDEPEIEAHLWNGILEPEAEEGHIGVHHGQADVADK